MDFFENDSILEIFLKGNLSDLFNDREIRSDHITSLTYKNATASVKTHVLGHSRAQFCNVPPLMVKFKKHALMEFPNNTSLKLVTHCDKSKGSRSIRKEYLAYRLQDHLLNKSFKVRMLNIHYQDSLNTHSGEYLGFFIENFEMIGTRTNLKCLENSDSYLPIEIDRTYTNRVSFIQFLLGNRDWFYNPNKWEFKNIKLFSNGTETYPILYDFDLAFSNDVTDYNYPYCSKDYLQDLEKEKKWILDQESNIFKFIENEKYLPAEEKQKYISFITEKLNQIKKAGPEMKLFPFNCLVKI